jgi:hypothetical protein
VAISATISQKELQRVASVSYEGETLKVMLCNVGVTGYTAENTVAQWQAQELSGDGYVRYSEVIGVGSYNSTEGRYELPSIDADFTCDGSPWSYDRVILYIDGATYPYAVLTEDPNIVLADGQTQTYRLSLNSDD